ncbi:hypothetical protein [Pseudooceanicola sp.]|uniref:hypothetical protein n=1 Tax=Pseudooceanicola sp. TaxID=1914328 RepID=UPI0035C68EDD
MTAFRCPEWERGSCHCPGGTVRPECPGLRDAQPGAWTPCPLPDDDTRAGAGIVWLLICSAVLLIGIGIGRLM